ncbi:Ig-like domain-containing protein [Mycolicibacterium sp. CBMA 335]|uniref:beta strand repeat-containing protein n=1 Tax=Mycolicibacterium sp. CBMA 335 TaxID=2606603 RepID=UPI0013919B00|nr:Ig-like domain-containing protein [Mycolicibacterium sp. CBMA 335]
MPATAVINPTALTSAAPVTQTRLAAVTNAAVTNAPVTAPVAPPTSPWVPVLNLVAGVLTIFGANPQGPTPPASPVGAFLWGLFRQLETNVGVAPPVAGTATVGPPNPATGAVTGALGATEQAGLPLTYVVSTTPANGTVTVDSTGTYTYTPTANARLAASIGGATADAFTVTVSDGLASSNESVNVPISAVADTPSAPKSVSQIAAANGVVTGTLTSTDPLVLPVTYSAATNPVNGTVTVTAAGGYTYTPTLLAQEQASVGGATADSFTVTATNGTYTSTAGTISVPITAVADTPNAPTSASQSTATNGVVTGTLTATDPAGKTLTYSAASNPANGTVTVTAAGGYTYTPSLLAQEQASVGGATADSFTVTATNGTYTSTAGTISVPITAVADTPNAPTSASQSTATNGVVTGTLTATDPAGKTLTYSAASNPANGTVTVTAAGGYTYTPSLLAQEQASVGGATADSFTVTASNGTYTSTAGTISVPITAVADTPGSPQSASQSTAANGVVTGTLTATDPASKTLTYSAASGPASGAVTVTAAGGYTYTPTLLAQEQASVGGATTDSFTVTATNGTYTSTAGTISVPITAVADTPSAPQNGLLAVGNNGAVSGVVSSIDPAGQSLTYAVASHPTSGQVTLNAATGAFTYTPAALAREEASVGGATTDSFTVTASNSTYTSAAGTISVVITPLADTPSAPQSLSQSTAANGVVTGTLTSIDPAGKTLTYSAASNPANGTVTVTAAGGYTYTPSTLAQEKASVGGPTTDSFTVTATNGTYTSTAGTISVPITAVADTPNAPTSASQSTAANGVVTGTLTATDPAGKSLSYNVVTNGGPASGTVTVTAAGGYTYTPSLLAQEQASVGGPTTDSFTVTATNGTYTSAAGTISVPISAISDTPSAPQSASQSTNASGVVTGTLTATDPAGKTLTYSAATNPANGTVTVTAAGAYTYTPSQAAQLEAGLGGPTTDSFTVTATNGTYTSTAGTISVPITSAAINVTNTLDFGTNPQAIAVSPSGSTAYVANSSSNTVSAINIATGAVIYTTVVGTNPYGVAVSPNGNIVYVTDRGSNTLSMIYSPAGAAINIPVGSSPEGVAVSPDGTTVYVANFGSGTVSVINTATNSVTNIPVVPRPIAVAVSPAGGLAYVVSEGNFSTRPAVSVISTATDTLVGTMFISGGSSGAQGYGVAFSPNGQVAYVVSTGNNPFGGGTLAVINTATTTLTAVLTVGSLPTGVAFSPDGSLAYVTNSGANTVSVINTATNTVIATQQVGAQPFAVAVNPSTGAAYITNELDNTVSVLALGPITSPKPNTVIATIPASTEFLTTSPNGNFVYLDQGTSVSVINTATNTVVNTFPVVASNVGGDGIAVSPDGSRLYIATGNAANPTTGAGTVSVINTATDSVIASVSVGPEPFGIAITPNGSTAYVINTPGSVSVINTATNTVTNTITVSGQPLGVAANPNGATVYVATSAGISVINTATNTVTATVPANGAFGVAVSPNGHTVYLATSGGVEVIDTATNVVTTTIPGGATQVAVSPDGNFVYATNSGETVTVIDTATNTVIDTVTAGSETVGLTVTPDGKYVYVANIASGTVSVIYTGN